jgi:hypothetical protein
MKTTALVRPFCVVLIGPDGCGKTTVSRRIVERADLPFARRELVHESFYVLPRLDRVVALWEHLTHAQPPPSAPDGRHMAMLPLLPVWASVLIVTYHAMDMFLGRLRLWRLRRQSCLLVFDRSFYDYFFLRGHGNLPRWYLRLVSRLVPAPDLMLYLDRDAARIYEDKPELSLEEIRRQQRAVETLVRAKPFAQAIRAGDGIDVTVERVTDSIRCAAGKE